MLKFIFLSLLISVTGFAQKAVLVDEGSTETETIKPTRSKSFFSREEVEEAQAEENFQTTFDLRSRHRLGVGVEAMGKMGLIGLQAELNFAIDDSALVGFGGGPQYTSFSMGWRHIFGGNNLAAFTSVHYARLYAGGNSGSISETTPQFVGEKFLTAEEKSTGKFAVNMIVPGAGLQYNILGGQYVGTSMYIELSMLISLSNFNNSTTGAFGVIRYF